MQQSLDVARLLPLFMVAAPKDRVSISQFEAVSGSCPAVSNYIRLANCQNELSDTLTNHTGVC